MDRLIAPNSVPFAQADTAPTTGTPQYATDGNPASNVPATQWPAYAWNTIQDEIYNVIVGAGLTPDRTKWNQLLTAIQTMMQGSTTNVSADTGAVNAYVVAFTPALPAPVPWVPFWFKVAHTNTGASTLNVSGTAYGLVGGAHLPLQGNELVANGDALVYWNPTLNSGAGQFVLLLCSGAAEQVAAASKSNHAVNLGQFETIAAYLASQSGSLGNPVASTTYTPASQSITFPSFSKSGAFRVLAQLVTSGFSQTNTVECQFQNQLFDGTNTAGQGNFWNVYKKNTGTGFAAADTFLSVTTYAPGSTITFLQRTVVQIEDTQFSLQNCFMRLWVVEA
ncbi:hypothetical protein [Paraburkholderia acidiphila]|uniref:Tail fiber protein n=1 Tax=Paraburkholderia acidiphila TaxID=2571747 RepID=A0A7Z2G815_9BURK|nr:hypothetical protein [Paraburkholderia acidiphila]QGZ56762.1 hypothetical protein FAZ97_17520 [Paraburkholderia acidiphila]